MALKWKLTDIGRAKPNRHQLIVMSYKPLKYRMGILILATYIGDYKYTRKRDGRTVEYRALVELHRGDLNSVRSVMRKLPTNVFTMLDPSHVQGNRMRQLVFDKYKTFIVPRIGRTLLVDLVKEEDLHTQNLPQEKKTGAKGIINRVLGWLLKR